ncbi:hypothetical protein [Rubrivivax benzoatilyticus]|uniref:Uncharacterized protein n=1 Tax=Rubrivivax benzoatilyticus TaxID=316997 RepID=A0ABX0HUI5_9BURK|nr:hypothetical protein [Rubrivivax benzoatilyticus]EGJ09767.1 hypothetical protein RBXJA2T_05528 [Rubrivivax benzoatilyticus JA2 = ATCC BAA-35]NHK97444.1 hypothetical protein [Rubrivivax benzoatilyticus]NHL22861.1 hypothetical protein [Rubrivivax benzoatilyticus]
MKTLTLEPLPPERLGPLLRWSCDLHRSGDGEAPSRQRLWFESAADQGATLADDDAEPYLIATLMLAMQEGRTLVVGGRVSRLLLANLEEYQAFWHATAPRAYRRVQVIVAPGCIDDAPALVDPAGEAIAAFSGGLDASFLAWRHHARLAGERSRRIRFFVMLEGFDIRTRDAAHAAPAIAAARETLADLGGELRVLRTNFRDVVPVIWNHAHGSALVACMHFFKAHAGTVLVASCEKYDDLVIPWGMSPISDPLLSSAALRVLHDGAECSRSEKARALEAWPAGKDRLRVCWGTENPGGNCMRCEKCLRTMANFAAQGLAVPRSLGGSETALNRGIVRIKLRTLAQESEWRSIAALGRGRPRRFWQRWIPVLLAFARLRRAYYVTIGRPDRAGMNS